MTLDLGHFAFGAAMTSLLITFFVPTVWHPQTLVVLGGGWALLPDVHWVTPVWQAELYTFHHSVWAELFWFHRTLDRLDPGDSKLVSAGLLVFFILTTFLAERRSYRAPELLRESIIEGSDLVREKEPQ